MEIIKKLRNMPTGFTVRLGGTTLEVVRFNPYRSGSLCGGCAFRDSNLGAKHYPYASACMAHLRPDRESVVFAKTKEI